MQATIVDPSGVPVASALAAASAALVEAGFTIRQACYPEAAGDRLAAAGVRARAALLNQALETSDVVLCARGGYGISDLLETLPMAYLAHQAPRLVVGFSDISALHSALYARLGWPALHAPMPGSLLWSPKGPDVAALVQILRAWPGPCEGRLGLAGEARPAVRGTLFGGCLSVLGALIGTPWFPSSLRGHVVFLEDVNESAPRVLRHFNQWRQAGVLDGVAAVVLGRFVHHDEAEAEALAALPEKMAERCACPVYVSADFGHVAPNYPLMTGAIAELSGSTLHWRLDPGPMIA